MKRLIIILLLFAAFSVTAQEDVNSDIQEKLAVYHQEHPSANLYVHTDKNNYMPGDTIWFKAYMLSALEGRVLFVNLNTDTAGKAGFEFYTSDIKSDYIIVVQGVEIHTLKPVYYTYKLQL